MIKEDYIMNFKKVTNKILKVSRKKDISQVLPKLIIALGAVSIIGVLVCPKSVKRIFKDLKKKDMTNTDDFNEMVHDTVDTINNTNDFVENKVSEIKDEASDLINDIVAASKEVKEEIKKTTEVLSNEVDTLTCPIKEIIKE
jgi:gas vesicle protein